MKTIYRKLFPKKTELTAEDTKLAGTFDKIQFVSEHQKIIDLAITGAVEQMQKQLQENVVTAKDKMSLRNALLGMAAQVQGAKGNTSHQSIINAADEFYKFVTIEDYKPSKILTKS